MIPAVTESAKDRPLRGVLTIEWSDSGSGWGATPQMSWSMVDDPPLDRSRLRLLLASLLAFAEQEDVT